MPRGINYISAARQRHTARIRRPDPRPRDPESLHTHADFTFSFARLRREREGYMTFLDRMDPVLGRYEPIYDAPLDMSDSDSRNLKRRPQPVHFDVRRDPPAEERETSPVEEIADPPLGLLGRKPASKGRRVPRQRERRDSEASLPDPRSRSRSRSRLEPPLLSLPESRRHPSRVPNSVPSDLSNRARHVRPSAPSLLPSPRPPARQEHRPRRAAQLHVGPGSERGCSGERERLYASDMW